MNGFKRKRKRASGVLAERREWIINILSQVRNLTEEPTDGETENLLKKGEHIVWKKLNTIFSLKENQLVTLTLNSKLKLNSLHGVNGIKEKKVRLNIRSNLSSNSMKIIQILMTFIKDQ